MKYYRFSFLLLLMIGLFLPLFFMNMADISEQENRTLAKFPELRKKGGINSDYGREFEAWLGDRFGGRTQLIDSRFQVLYKISGRMENETAFVGDDGWVFMKSETVNIPSLKDQRIKIDRFANTIKQLNQKLGQENVFLYVVLVPSKDRLLQKYWRNYYPHKPELHYEEEIVKILSSEKNIGFVYPEKEFSVPHVLRDVYMKGDVHLSKKGKEIVVKSVFDRLVQDFPDFNGTIKSEIKTQKYTNKPSYLKGYVVEDEVSYVAFEYGNNEYIKQEEESENGEKGYEKGHSKNYLSDFSFYSIGVC
jgi:hypothetical protein